MKVKELIPSMLCNLYKLSKAGGKDVNTILDYNSIYQTYSSLRDESKMVKYQITAETCKVSIQSVMNAVKFMEKSIY